MSYVPGVTLGIVKFPSAPLSVSDVIPVSTLRAMILAFVTTAPLASRTVPTKVPVIAWPHPVPSVAATLAAINTKEPIAATQLLLCRVINPPC